MENEPNQIESAVVEIKKEQTEIISSIGDLVVNDAKSLLFASDVLKKVKTAYDFIEEKRLKYVKPLKDQTKKIDADFKAAGAPYLEMEKSIKQKMAAYLDQERVLAEIKQKKLDDDRRAEAQKLAEDANISTRQAMTLVQKTVVTPAPTMVRTETAKIVSKLVPMFEITDIRKVPDEYKVVDEKLIRKAVQAGSRRIAGVRIWEGIQINSY